MATAPRTEPPPLLQIAPAGTGGVLDYLRCLQATWHAQGVPSQVIALSQAAARHRSLVQRVDSAIATGTIRVSPARGPQCSVVLHYSGYGYEPRGLCFWLLDEVRALRARHGRRLRLVIVFHELYASGGPWWRSAFWLSPLQARIARRLARLADALWTNSEQHAQWLHSAVDAQVPVEVRPVFSNVGEPASVPVAADREPQAVVFGSVSTRQRAFDALHGHEDRLRSLGVESLVEVGPGPASSRPPGSIPCRHAGRLEADLLGRLLMRSRFGLLDYPSALLTKSGVLAAYAAHGCVVIDSRPPGPDTDGLAAGRDYLALQTLRPEDSSLPAHEAMAASLRHWYAQHRLSDQAHRLLELAIDDEPVRTAQDTLAPD